ncbi:hypothetical protein FIBSPDRAFT_872744, partial [Athelia psychrophila]
MSLLVSSHCASFSESTVAPFHLPPSRTRNSSQMHPQSPLTASFGASLSSSTTVSAHHSWHLSAAHRRLRGADEAGVGKAAPSAL